MFLSLLLLERKCSSLNCVDLVASIKDFHVNIKDVLVKILIFLSSWCEVFRFFIFDNLGLRLLVRLVLSLLSLLLNDHFQD